MSKKEKIETLTQEEILEYKDDDLSAYFYRFKFMWVKYTLLPFLLIFMAGAFAQNNIAIVVGFSGSVLIGLLSIFIQSRTTAQCNNCKGNMSYYFYDSGHKKDTLGHVYICKNCKTKFIVHAPDSGSI